MSLRTLIGPAVWPALFLTAFAVSIRLLPPRPLMTVAPPEGASSASFSPDCSLLITQPMFDREVLGPLSFWGFRTAKNYSFQWPNH
jgi:hypothetical protein